jgi:hypothetical protein
VGSEGSECHRNRFRCGFGEINMLEAGSFAGNVSSINDGPSTLAVLPLG